MYKQVYRPNHHRADITGLVSVHILVAEESLGRPLEKGEIVHHKDFNKLNNDVDNLLFPISRTQHQKLPEYQARFILSKGLYEEFLTWWKWMQKHDEFNSKITEVERKLTQAENKRERLKGKLNANRSKSEDNFNRT